MQVTDIVSLVANVGFPVTLCFILIKYVLQTFGEKLDHMNETINKLTQEIIRLEAEHEGNENGVATGAKFK